MHSLSFRSSLAPVVYTLAGLLSFATTAAAQVPDNWAVATRFQGANTLGQLGGLSLIDLSAPGTATAITGLSAELTGTGLGTEGSASVLVDGRTGNLVIGEHALPGDTTDIHVLTLAGTTVINDDRYTLGTRPGGIGSVDQMAWLGDDVLFSVRGKGITSGIMAGHLLGVLRPRLGPPGTPGTITPVPLTVNPIGTINSLALDEKNGFAYFSTNQAQVQSDIYRVPVPGDGVTPVAPMHVATVTAGVLNLIIEGDGQLLAGCSNWGTGRLLRIDITQPTASVTPLTASLHNINAMVNDNATGNVLVANSANGAIYSRQANGALNYLTSLPLTDGFVSGLAIRQTIETYGLPTPGQNNYEWALAPNPGGEPSIGNSGFSMTSTASGVTALGLVGLSLAEAPVNIPILGVSLLLDPTTMVLPTVLLPAPSTTIPLPIPNTASLAGMRIYAQTFHSEATGWAASRGLRITLVP